MERFPGLNTKLHGGSYVPRISDNPTSTASNQTQSSNTSINGVHGHAPGAGSGHGGNQGFQSSLGGLGQTNIYSDPSKKPHGGGYIPK